MLRIENPEHVLILVSCGCNELSKVFKCKLKAEEGKGPHD